MLLEIILYCYHWHVLGFWSQIMCMTLHTAPNACDSSICLIYLQRLRLLWIVLGWDVTQWGYSESCAELSHLQRRMGAAVCTRMQQPSLKCQWLVTIWCSQSQNWHGHENSRTRAVATVCVVVLCSNSTVFVLCLWHKVIVFWSSGS